MYRFTRINFFQSPLVSHLRDENRLLQKSTSWWEIELADKRKILEAFWQERIVKFNQKSVDEFKRHIMYAHFPCDAAWQRKINKLFSDAVLQKISFDTFFNTLKYLPLGHFLGLNSDEKLIDMPKAKSNEVTLEVTMSDLLNIKRYIVEKGMLASIAFRLAEGALIAPDFIGNKSCCFSMHSIGKVFTGMLALIMVRQGIIKEADLKAVPVKLDESVKLALPSSVKERLTKVSLHQLMTHTAGLGNYLQDYCSAISLGKVPEIERAEDFLRFAEKEVSPIGKFRYSNLGILIVGLAIQHAYENRYSYCYYDYNKILRKHIIDKVGMPSFTPLRPNNAKTNSADFIAPYMAASPAGGYWVTAEDLAKFGEWICKQTKADSELEVLMQKYGQEFYNAENRIVSHGGGIPSASAFFSVSLATGEIIATLSDQPDMAFDLYAMVKRNIFSKSSVIIEEEDSDTVATPTAKS